MAGTAVVSVGAGEHPPSDPGEAVAGHGRLDFPMAGQNALRTSVKIFDAPDCAAELRKKIRRAKFPCGASQKNLTLQIAPRTSEKKFDAPNFSAEL